MIRRRNDNGLSKIKLPKLKLSTRGYKYTSTLKGQELGLKQVNRNQRFTGVEVRGI